MADTQTSPAPPIADQAKEQVQQVAEAGKQAGVQVVEQGKQMAGSLLDRAREQVKTQLGTQKENLTTGLNDVAQALLLSSNHLQDQGQGGVAHYGDQAAEQITKLSGYLREHGVDEVLGEMQTFARRKPGLTIGAAVLLGLAAARFLKSAPSVAGQSAPAGTNGGSGAHAIVPVSAGKTPESPQKGTPDGEYEGVGVGQTEVAGHYAAKGGEGVRDGDAT